MVNYTDDWYQDESKASGGYTIERINLIDPCSDALNWSASNALTGGTPGNQNSIFDNTEDIEPPQLLNTLALNPNYLQVEFNEGIDSNSLIDLIFNTEPSLTIANTYIESAYANGLIFSFNENLIPSQTYSFSLSNIRDCWLNPASLSGTFALPELAYPGDLVINEILSNPYSDGEDWIELYNTTENDISLVGLFLSDDKSKLYFNWLADFREAIMEETQEFRVNNVLAEYQADDDLSREVTILSLIHI